MMLRRFLLVSSLFAGSLLPSLAHGAEFLEGESLSLTVPVNADLYAAGASVRINQPVQGDLVVVGGTLLFADEVGGDLMATGGNVTLQGTVRDDVRVAGGTLNVGGTIGGDLFVFGGTVIIQETAVIGGDLIIAGGDVTVLGSVDGGVWARGGVVQLLGSVTGPVDARGGDVTVDGTVNGPAVLAAEELTIGGSAAFGGEIRYWTEDGPLDAFGGTGTGAAIFDPSLRFEEPDVAAGAGAVFGVLAVGSFLSASLLMLLLALLARPLFRDAAVRLERRPLMMLWWGFLFYAVTPIIALLLFLTVIGIPLGIFVLIAYLFALFFSWAFAALVSAQWFQNRLGLPQHALVFLLLALLAYVLIAALTLVPVLGWLAQALLVLACVGALTATKMGYARTVMGSSPPAKPAASRRKKKA